MAGEPFTQQTEVDQWRAAAMDGLGRVLALHADTHDGGISGSPLAHIRQSYDALNNATDQAYRDLGLQPTIPASFDTFADYWIRKQA